MSLPDIKRIVSTRNKGELLLVVISNALNAGRLPAAEDIERLDQAVAAMLAASDPQERINILQRKLGLQNPEGRPPNDAEEGTRQARAYWWYRCMGEKKTRALSLTAEMFDLSIDTIKRRVAKYPKAGRAIVAYHPKEMRPTDVIAEIRELQDKAKTS